MEIILESLSVLMRVLLAGLFALAPGIPFWLVVAVLLEARRRLGHVSPRARSPQPSGEPSV